MTSSHATTAMTAHSHSSPTRDLAELMRGMDIDVPAGLRIAGLGIDSRKIGPGVAFIALPGTRTHGLAYAREAVAAGSSVVLWEPTENVDAPDLPSHVSVIRVPELTTRLGTIADRFFGSPSQTLRVAGITGTNGKTTSAYMLAAALEQVGFASAYAGTLGYGRVGQVRARPHTTPDCISVHRELAELRDEGVRCVGMEVTSHALDQHRVAGVRFESAIFTNLTRDHLDYHGTLDAYGEAKARLFAWPDLRHGIVNIDDAFGRKLAGLQSVPLILYGSEASLADFAGPTSHVRHVCARSVVTEPLGLNIELATSWGEARLRSRLIGHFNVDNLLAVLAALLSFDVPLTQALGALERCAPPPGRMEMLTAPGKPLVIVDYAHTPDALEKALHAIRAHCSGKIWCVFGCGGERDRGKRPLMGAIAEAHADGVIVTDDNPRGEDGEVIVAAILDGMKNPERAHVERDRAAAIELAIRSAQPGDAVLVAGKGHEDYQIIGATTRAFSDRDVALAALRRSA